MKLSINAEKEKKKIILFIKDVLKKQKFKNVVIGISGGIDSAVSLSLLRKSIPGENIFVAHTYYFKSQADIINPLFEKLNIPQKNICNISIKNAVDSLKEAVGLKEDSLDYKIRLGNIMARVRMVILYDLAKKNKALVCGTENKSELHLGYFTRFGDEASDFEPIQHLYKTQVYELAKNLDIPAKIIDQTPTAGLWAGQTDEKDFGFTYKEADNVLCLYFEKKNNISQIRSKGFLNAEKIIDWVHKNSFKHHLPYVIDFE